MGSLDILAREARTVSITNAGDKAVPGLSGWVSHSPTYNVLLAAGHSQGGPSQLGKTKGLGKASCGSAICC